MSAPHQEEPYVENICICRSSDRMRSYVCPNADTSVFAAATVSGEALGGRITVRLTRLMRPRFSLSRLSRARSIERSTAEERASSLTASRSDDPAIKALKDLISSGVICKGKILKATSTAFVQRYDTNRFPVTPVTGQNQEEPVSADEFVGLGALNFAPVSEMSSSRPRIDHVPSAATTVQLIYDPE
ncbi:hypothetical protein [Bradyrhizobium sp.]|uniref:hypothetical protein n=1 Tax=Bradyrhizobium sp. TaxID=376 RepID=UPI003C3B6502